VLSQWKSGQRSAFFWFSPTSRFLVEDGEEKRIILALGLLPHTQSTIMRWKVHGGRKKSFPRCCRRKSRKRTSTVCSLWSIIVGRSSVLLLWNSILGNFHHQCMLSFVNFGWVSTVSSVSYSAHCWQHCIASKILSLFPWTKILVSEQGRVLLQVESYHPGVACQYQKRCDAM
jgi:hypothetical protein